MAGGLSTCWWSDTKPTTRCTPTRRTNTHLVHSLPPAQNREPNSDSPTATTVSTLSTETPVLTTWRTETGSGGRPMCGSWPRLATYPVFASQTVFTSPAGAATVGGQRQRPSIHLTATIDPYHSGHRPQPTPNVAPDSRLHFLLHRSQAFSLGRRGLRRSHTTPLADGNARYSHAPWTPLRMGW